MLHPSIVYYQHPKFEDYCPAIPAMVMCDPVPAHAIGSIAWVQGERACRLCVIVALARGGRHIALVDSEGTLIRCSYRRLWLLGPTRWRTLAAAALRRRGLPVARH